MIPPHPLTNFQIKIYYQNEPTFSGVYYKEYVNNKSVTYFDSFGVEHIPKEIKKFINNKNTIANIFRILAYDSVMCGYFCIGFIDFMLEGNSLTD